MRGRFIRITFRESNKSYNAIYWRKAVFNSTSVWKGTHPKIGPMTSILEIGNDVIHILLRNSTTTTNTATWDVINYELNHTAESLEMAEEQAKEMEIWGLLWGVREKEDYRLVSRTWDTPWPLQIFNGRSNFCAELCIMSTWHFSLVLRTFFSLQLCVGPLVGLFIKKKWSIFCYIFCQISERNWWIMINNAADAICLKCLFTQNSFCSLPSPWCNNSQFTEDIRKLWP